MSKNTNNTQIKHDTLADNSGLSSDAIAMLEGNVFNSIKNLIDDETASDSSLFSSAKIYSLLPEDTASGAVASFSNGIPGFPIVDATFNITTYQDGTGTPAPDNVRNIHGHTDMDIMKTGKNLFTDNNATVGYFINSSGITQGSSEWNLSDYIFVPSNTELYFNPNSTSGGSAKHAFYDINKNFISVVASGEGSFTTPINCVYMRFSYRSTSEDIQLELGSSATAYAAYNGAIYPLTWQNECYGGYIDYARGKKVTTYGYLEGVEITEVSSGTYPNVELTSSMLTGISQTVNSIVLMNKYDQISNTASPADKKFKKRTTYITIYDSDFTDVDAANAILSDLKIAYELATPIEEDITLPVISVLEGVNNIWCDTGDSSVTYKTYIT